MSFYPSATSRTAKKSFFAQSELEHLATLLITREGIQPLTDKVKAIMNIAEPTTLAMISLLWLVIGGQSCVLNVCEVCVEVPDAIYSCRTQGW